MFYADACARGIAQAHAGDSTPALGRLASTGMIGPGLVEELTEAQGWLQFAGNDPEGVRQLGWLLDYAELHGLRGPQGGWNRLPDPTPLRVWTGGRYGLELFTSEADPNKATVYYRLLERSHEMFAGPWTATSGQLADSDDVVEAILASFTVPPSQDETLARSCDFGERTWRERNADPLRELLEAFKASIVCPTCEGVGTVEVDGTLRPCDQWLGKPNAPVCGGSGRWDRNSRTADSGAAWRIERLAVP